MVVEPGPASLIRPLIPTQLTWPPLWVFVLLAITLFCLSFEAFLRIASVTIIGRAIRVYYTAIKVIRALLWQHSAVLC